MTNRKVTRKVIIENQGGRPLTAHELMMAMSQVPVDMVPRIYTDWKARPKKVEFEAIILDDENQGHDPQP